MQKEFGQKNIMVNTSTESKNFIISKILMQKILWSKTSLVQKFLVWSNFHVQLIRINAKKYCCQKWALDQKNIVDHKFFGKKKQDKYCLSKCCLGQYHRDSYNLLQMVTET